MQTKPHPKMANIPHISEAEDILRACVHCGFCNATCPTYQHFGDERDGPRGRIYLIKQLLETNEVSDKTQIHLDRCLQCRSCETTCPSGVKYGRLLDIGRAVVEEKVPRTGVNRLQRYALRKMLPYPNRFGFLLFWGRLLRPLLSKKLQAKIPPKQTVLSKELLAEKQQTLSSNSVLSSNNTRTMLALAGCAQSVTAPNTNITTTRVLKRLGIHLIEAPKAGCCGAVDYHLSAHYDGLQAMRKNIDAWWPAIEAGAEAIVMTASGCGVMVKEYGERLAHDQHYAEKAQRVSELTRDISEILINEDLTQLRVQTDKKTAYHCPCTLQHGQQLSGVVEDILKRAGVPLAETSEQHLCCGSAGTYSILQTSTSQQLLSNKLTALTQDNPDHIVTANIGCQLHLASQSDIPVKHWIELLDH